METFYLETPGIKRKEEAIEYIKEHKKYNSKIHGTSGLNKYYNDYEKWLENLENQKIESTCPKNYVPSNTYFLIKEDEDKIIGMINIRHKLNESLKNYGGHIGYGIRPTERQKGYNKINLYLALQKCQELGLNKVLITATDNNPGSYKTILSLGGKLENKIPDDEEENIQLGRYWIEVNKSLEENYEIYKNYITNQTQSKQRKY